MVGVALRRQPGVHGALGRQRASSGRRPVIQRLIGSMQAAAGSLLRVLRCERRGSPLRTVLPCINVTRVTLLCLNMCSSAHRPHAPLQEVDDVQRIMPGGRRKHSS